MSAERTLDTLAIGDRNGMVVISFPEPKSYIELDEETARRVGEALAKQAYKVRFGDFPTPAKTAITDMQRIRLAQRVTLMLRSMANEAPVPEYNVQANRIVDEVLRGA